MFLFVLGAGLLSFSNTSFATETLLDNNLDLKTDRLNQKQEDNKNAQSFVATDRLFEEEMIGKVAHAKQVATKQREEEESKLFLNRLPRTKETDHTQLFAGNENNQAAIRKEETVTTVSSPMALFPLILGLVLVTVVTLVLYHSRKRGQQDGR